MNPDPPGLSITTAQEVVTTVTDTYVADMRHVCIDQLNTGMDVQLLVESGVREDLQLLSSVLAGLKDACHGGSDDIGVAQDTLLWIQLKGLDHRLAVTGFETGA